MRKLLAFVGLLLPGLVWGQTYNQFKPANGILKGSTSTYVTTAATSGDVTALFGTTANSFLATPDGSTGVLSLRTITLNDLPTITATHGGTGQTTITVGDLLYGSASNVLSKLAGNTTSTKQFLTQTGNGTVSAAPAWGSISTADLPALGGNPTGSVGTTAVNGTATTYVRSDASLPIDQTMSPSNLTGTWTWAASSTFTNNSTNTVTAGAALVNGGRFGATSTTRPTNGLAAGAGNTTVIAANGAQSALFNGNGRVDLGAILSTGTKFTTSGCSVSATTGGASAGTFTVGANSCTVVITMNGATGMAATNGWSCFAEDTSALTLLISQSASTTTTASLNIPATAGTTDVIRFGCIAY